MIEWHGDWYGDDVLWVCQPSECKDKRSCTVDVCPHHKPHLRASHCPTNTTNSFNKTACGICVPVGDAQLHKHYQFIREEIIGHDTP